MSVVRSPRAIASAPRWPALVIALSAAAGLIAGLAASNLWAFAVAIVVLAGTNGYSKAHSP